MFNITVGENMEKKIIYYTDELNDDFAGLDSSNVSFGDDYKYIHKNIFWKIGSFIVYRIIMTPIAYLYLKLKFKTKFIGRNKLKSVKGGYFIFANHTMIPGDGYTPSIATFPKRDYVVVGKDNLAMKGTRTFMKMIGAYLVPETMKMTRNFLDGMEYYLNKKCGIVIYPEAHIWPYYTKIRPFKNVSFQYPVKFDKPSFSMCVTYQKRKHSDKPKVTIYIDGPFYPNQDLPTNKAKQIALHKDVYDSLVKNSENSNYEYIIYKRKEQ